MNAVLPPSNIAIIAAGISIVIVTAVNGIGTALSTKFTEVSTSLK